MPREIGSTEDERITVNLEGLRARLVAQAEDEGCTVSDLVRRALDEYLRAEEEM